MCMSIFWKVNIEILSLWEMFSLKSKHTKTLSIINHNSKHFPE